MARTLHDNAAWMQCVECGSAAVTERLGRTAQARCRCPLPRLPQVV